MKLNLEAAVSAFGAKAKAKLASPGATGQPEDQLRAPFEQLLSDLAVLCELKPAPAPDGGETADALPAAPAPGQEGSAAAAGFYHLARGLASGVKDVIADHILGRGAGPGREKTGLLDLLPEMEREFA